MFLEREQPLCQVVAAARNYEATAREALTACDRALLTTAANIEEESQKERAFDEAQANLSRAKENLQELRERGGAFLVICDAVKALKQLLVISQHGVITLVDAETGEVIAGTRRFADQLVKVAPGKDKEKDAGVVTVEWASGVGKPWQIRCVVDNANQPIPDTRTASQIARSNSAALPVIDKLFLEENLHSGYVATPTPAELEETLGCILKRQSRRLNAAVLRLRELHQLLRTPVSLASPVHERLLWEFRRIALNSDGSAKGGGDTGLESDTFSESVHQGWQRLGFQSMDPLADFRIAGALGLHCLIYFANYRTNLLQKIIKARKDYPFATVVISAVVYLLQNGCRITDAQKVDAPPSAPHWQSPLIRLFCRCAHPKAFEECCCILVLLFDAIFVRASAKHTQLSMVLDSAKRKFENALDQSPLSLDELSVLCERGTFDVYRVD